MKRTVSLEPQQVDKDTWYYEYPGSILVVHWMNVGDGSRVCAQFRVPKRKLLASLKRMGI